jgi:hypothetical protein
MAAHQTILSSPMHVGSAPAAMAATLNFDANSTLRNAGLRSPVPHSESKQLPAMFIEADKNQRSSEDSWEASEHAELEVPVLDLEVLNSGPDKLGQRQELVKAMAKACQKWGFFQVLNHGVDQALIDRCEVEAHRMFALPLEVKERVHRPPGTSFGYGANTWVNQKVLHWAESFHMQLHPTSNIHEMAAKLFAKGDPNQFRYRLFVNVPLCWRGLGYAQSSQLSSNPDFFFPFKCAISDCEFFLFGPGVCAAQRLRRT